MLRSEFTEVCDGAVSENSSVLFTFSHSVYIKIYSVVLGGLVDNVLAVSPMFRRFIPDRRRWIFKDDKIHSTPSFRGDHKAVCPIS
jgi:hypothetical protein